MNNPEARVTTLEKFTWKIENFSKLGSKKLLFLYSQNFFLWGHPWHILIYPTGENGDYFKIYLDVDSLPCDWSKRAYFKLALINQTNDQKTKRYETKHDFKVAGFLCGYSDKFITFGELREPNGGFIVNDICIIEAQISFYNSEPENQANNSFPELISSASSSHNELIDFKGLGKIEKVFVPFLEEVCSWHPSLVETLKKRSRTHMFNEWAFIALGRVLHFLKTKKFKDMCNVDACNELQILWEELETFGFNLTWLKPQVQSAIDMKSYNKRAVHVKKLRGNVDTIEADLRIARRELVKAEQDFTQRDLDAELGYGGP